MCMHRPDSFQYYFVYKEILFITIISGLYRFLSLSVWGYTQGGMGVKYNYLLYLLAYKEYIK